MIFRRTDSTNLYTVMDLGSNSFHLLAARIDSGQVMIIDRVREPVRLASGLDPQGNFTPLILQKAYQALERISQYTRDTPNHCVRIVGTNALRVAENADRFILRASQILGHPVEIISGLEEARLTYLGVAHDISPQETARLVIDIGGSSTEVIIGINDKPIFLDSFHMGSATYTGKYFADGKITAKRIKKAVLAARLELEPKESTLRAHGWSGVIGSSGTIKAIRKCAQQLGLDHLQITVQTLDSLLDYCSEKGNSEALEFREINRERQEVFIGGLCILSALFKALHIQSMTVSEHALREGILHDLIGRRYRDDIRNQTVNDFMQRFQINRQQANLVESTARHLFNQCRDSMQLQDEEWQYLGWAARLHEIGLSIAHTGYHKHGYYIITHADMLGFSQVEQSLLAFLVRAQRKKPPFGLLDHLPQTLRHAAELLAITLRLAVILNRAHSRQQAPQIAMHYMNHSVNLNFGNGRLNEHPLTQADLQQEAEHLAAWGYSLTFA